MHETNFFQTNLLLSYQGAFIAIFKMLPVPEDLNGFNFTDSKLRKQQKPSHPILQTHDFSDRHEEQILETKLRAFRNFM